MMGTITTRDGVETSMVRRRSMGPASAPRSASPSQASSTACAAWRRFVPPGGRGSARGGSWWAGPPSGRPRSALAKHARAARDPDVPRKPREGTKQEKVLVLLRRPEGATVAQIAEATGWAAHTVRGFFAGLKKKGVAVAVLERVRQVGPTA
jgi:Protein of unknown function (DUF3489)